MLCAAVDAWRKTQDSEAARFLDRRPGLDQSDGRAAVGLTPEWPHAPSGLTDSPTGCRRPDAVRRFCGDTEDLAIDVVEFSLLHKRVDA